MKTPRFTAILTLLTSLLLLAALSLWAATTLAQGSGLTTRVSVASNRTEANDWSHYPAISADGRYVTFQSDASNLIRGDTNGRLDIFVHD